MIFNFDMTTYIFVIYHFVAFLTTDKPIFCTQKLRHNQQCKCKKINILSNEPPHFIRTIFQPVLVDFFLLPRFYEALSQMQNSWNGSAVSAPKAKGGHLLNLTTSDDCLDFCSSNTPR